MKTKTLIKFLITLLILLTFFNLLNDFNYINVQDKYLIGLNNYHTLFMHSRPFSKKYTVYYINDIFISNQSFYITPDGSNSGKFYSSNYHNDLNIYIWLFELVLLINIIFLKKYKKN